ncbi:MAG: RHS repeat-associated core domain-containing protein [Sulfuricaulis sp.]
MTNYVYSPTSSDWLSQAGSDSRVLNPDGSTASTTSLGSLNYDGYGDLTGVAGATYAYDSFGRRNWKNVGSTWTAFAYGPGGELLYEAGVTNTTSYVYLNGAPLARIDNNNQIYYYHDDHLGSPQAMTNSTGAMVWQASYEPFGNATVTTSTVTNNLRLPGQYFDSETGFYYNNARYYDPKIGRYISSDPIGLGGGLNTYLYARANPLRYLDPSGEDIPPDPFETPFGKYLGELWNFSAEFDPGALFARASPYIGAFTLGYGVGTMINSACGGNCFNNLGPDIYDLTHPVPPQLSQPPSRSPSCSK